jgi:hypothetical protein
MAGGYVELLAKGNSRVYIKASHIIGVLTAQGCTGETQATSDKPLTVILSGGESLEGVYGVSPNRLLLHSEGVQEVVRRTGSMIKIAYIDKHEELESQIARLLDG